MFWWASFSGCRRFPIERVPGSNCPWRAVIETFQRQAALVDSAELSPSTPAAGLPFGLSARYWLELRDYDPVAIAAGLGKPMLILQGGRDDQVTVADDLVRWRAGLAGRRPISASTKPITTLFFPGAGPSTPAEYGTPQHVDPAVVADIAQWLSHGRGLERSRSL